MRFWIDSTDKSGGLYHQEILGQLIISTPYHGYLKNLALAVTGKLDKHFTVLWDNGHIKFFSVQTLTKLLKLEGYTDINFKFAGRCPYLWKSMLCSSKSSEAPQKT